MAFWDGQAGAFKDAGRAGGGRHACPRRGRAACGVGRSGRSEGEVGRRGVLWQEKSWARREVRSPPRSSPAHLAAAEPAFTLKTDGDQSPPVNFQAGMQQPGILQPAEADSTSIGRRRFTEDEATGSKKQPDKPSGKRTGQLLQAATRDWLALRFAQSPTNSSSAAAASSSGTR